MGVERGWRWKRSAGSGANPPGWPLARVHQREGAELILRPGDKTQANQTHYVFRHSGLKNMQRNQLAINKYSVTVRQKRCNGIQLSANDIYASDFQKQNTRGLVLTFGCRKKRKSTC
ncbi:unnamed protein product [Leuciscus chuanchicus]